jgi:hypothetical protein
MNQSIIEESNQSIILCHFGTLCPSLLDQNLCGTDWRQSRVIQSLFMILTKTQRIMFVKIFVALAIESVGNL